MSSSILFHAVPANVVFLLDFENLNTQFLNEKSVNRGEGDYHAVHWYCYVGRVHGK